MDISEALRKRIYELADNKKTNITNWCLQSNITPSTIFDFLYGKSKSLTSTTLAKLCAGIGITLEEFFSKDYLKDFDDIYK